MVAAALCACFTIGANAQPTAPAVVVDAVPIPQVRTLSVMTINVRNDKDFWEDRFPLIADEIVRLKPDIIGVQEMEIGIGQSRKLLRLLHDRDPSLIYNVYEHLKEPPDYFFGEGISILSRFPIEEKSYEGLGNGRIVLFARVKVDDALTVDMYNTHLHHQGGDPVRFLQAQKIVAFMEKNEKGNPVFLTGDMNSAETSETIKYYLSHGLRDSYKEFHNGVIGKDGETSSIILSKDNVQQDTDSRIDYVFFHPAASGGNISIKDSFVCFRNANGQGLYPSDHLGVMSVFEITPPGEEPR